MVNHMRTLFVNLTAADASAFSTVYTDPAFAPVAVTPALAAVGVALFGGAASQRVSMADRVLAVCSRKELTPYLYRFDSRTTAAEAPNGLTQFLTSADDGVRVSGLLSTLRELPALTGAAGVQLFQWTAYADDLARLRDAWNQRDDGLLRVGALALAYGYQLERARLGV